MSDLIRELENTLFSGKQSVVLKQRAEEWLWQELPRIIAALKDTAPAPVRQEGDATLDMLLTGQSFERVDEQGNRTRIAPHDVFIDPQPAQDDSCPQCGTNDLCGCGQDDGRAEALAAIKQLTSTCSQIELEEAVNTVCQYADTIRAALTRPVAGDRAIPPEVISRVVEGLESLRSLASDRKRTAQALIDEALVALKPYSGGA